MRTYRSVAATLVAAAIGLLATASPADAAGHTLIQGSGSSWAANAVNQWIADVHSNGLQVVFTSNGSATGRQDFANNTVDFAVSDIGYQGYDSVQQSQDTSNGRNFAYLPIVAGGTALTYHIEVGGQLLRTLRLSGQTIADIFTQKIHYWDDAEVKKDNPGTNLPHLAIIPVQHSEGSGSTYQFTRYLAKQFPGTWKYGATEYFPQIGGSAQAQNGSDGVINFLTSSAGNGAIGYDEYSYARGKNYPVAKVLNSAGYYTLPNQYNVAVALTKAQINMDKASKDYLLQNLDGVYGYSDKRVYPISSYSYAIIPTGTDAQDHNESTAKRQTLADYLKYSVCQGQAEMGHVGYSPLPVNLVQASFDQIGKLKVADPAVDISSIKVTACNNPTFVAGNPSANYLARIAPFPPACDKYGATPCTNTVDTGLVNPGQKPPPTNGTGGTGGSGGAGGSGGGVTSGGTGGSGGGVTSGGTGGTGGTGAGGLLASGGTGSTTRVDPATGQVVSVAGGTGGTSGQAAVAQSVNLAGDQSPSTDLTLGVLAAALLLGLLVAPPVASAQLRRRRAGS